MFTLRFFNGFVSQRKAFLKEREFAPIAVRDEIKAHLQALKQGSKAVHEKGITPARMWIKCIKAVDTLIWWCIRASIIMALGTLVSVLLTKELLDLSGSIADILLLCLGIFLVQILRHSVYYYELQRRAQIARGIQIFLITILNDKMFRIDRNRSDLGSGNLKTLISSDVESVEDLVSSFIQIVVPSVIMLLVLGPAIFLQSGTVGVVGIVVMFLQLPIAMFFARYIERFHARAQKNQDRLTSVIGEWVRNMRLIKFLKWENAFKRDIANEVRWMTIHGAKRHLLNCVTYSISHSWWMITALAMLAASHFLGVKTSVAGFFASFWALFQLADYISHLPWTISLYGTASAGMKRIVSLLNAPELDEKLRSQSVDISTIGIPTRIKFSNVTVAHADKNILQIPNLELNLRSRIAIVGSVGCGKSTLLELIAGEQSPTNGEILVEFSSGVSAPLWCHEVYNLFRNNLAYAPERPYLSNASIATNIALEDVADLADVRKAAESAALGPDIESFPNGYNEEIGETGINLSGGQKQRVSLARAFFSNRPYLLLDDPLSAVDRNTEGILFEEILGRANGFIMVSHRLDELTRCDRVIVLDNGGVVEDGDPSTLLKDPNSPFKRFVDATSVTHAEAV